MGTLKHEKSFITAGPGLGNKILRIGALSRVKTLISFRQILVLASHNARIVCFETQLSCKHRPSSLWLHGKLSTL